MVFGGLTGEPALAQFPVRPMKMTSADNFVSRHSVFWCVLLLALSACGKQEVSEGDHADASTEAHDAHANHSAPVLAEGERWPTDAPLRAAMNRIETAVGEAEPAYDNGKLEASAAQSLAAKVDADVRYMIENCKLAPEPDAALHVLIARMMSAAAALQSNPNSPEGVPELAAAVRDYRMTFDHADEHTH
jgi:hypothetical protein